jgi:hypothetical protein
LVVWAESIAQISGSGCSAAAPSNDGHILSPTLSWSQRLPRRLAQCVISYRIPQLFDMVKEYVETATFRYFPKSL